MPLATERIPLLLLFALLVQPRILSNNLELIVFLPAGRFLSAAVRAECTQPTAHKGRKEWTLVASKTNDRRVGAFDKISDERELALTCIPRILLVSTSGLMSH